MSLSIQSAESEVDVWEKAGGRWRLVHGGMLERGVSLEFHDFALDAPLDWGASFHEQSLEVCINLHGSATLRRGSTTVDLGDNEVAVYTVPASRPSALRAVEGHHCFYTLEFSCEWLRRHLHVFRYRLKPEILRFIERPSRARAFVERFPLPPAMIPLRIDLLAPPVPDGAQDAWYFGKIFEILASTIFRADQAMSGNDLRIRERVERARARLERDFENPPSLEDLGREADCSGFYLSRLFKQELGVSIPSYLRATRMEKAAAYLRKGMSVTDTAVAVGYSSVSAFIKAFGEYHQTTPSRWIAVWSKSE